MHARLLGPNNLYFFTKFKIEPDFPCLADEIAKLRLDMNIKVAAVTVSEMSINTKFTLKHNSVFETTL